jgi:AcrR family transcriptional regulator
MTATKLTRSPARVRGRDDALIVVPDGTAPPAHLSPDVFTAAHESWVADQRLDMQALARRLGVGRATLYRRAGNRDRLLDEVLWWRGRRALVEVVVATADVKGVARLVAVVETTMRSVRADRPLRKFLADEPEAALRILTGARSVVRQGMTDALTRLIDLETARGHFHADVDSQTLAFAIIRLTEGFLYSDVISDRVPDVEQATAVIEALLRGLVRR